MNFAPEKLTEQFQPLYEAFTTLISIYLKAGWLSPVENIFLSDSFSSCLLGPQIAAQISLSPTWHPPTVSSELPRLDYLIDLYCFLG